MRVQNFRRVWLMAFCVIASLSGANASADFLPRTKAIETVPYVDVARYLGTWYQVAHNPMWFEGGSDCACARQLLGATSKPFEVAVFNSCNDSGPMGQLRTISGTATNDDVATNSKFSVDFGLPYKGEYWIIGLDASYRYAVVTDSRGESLYILSKTSALDPKLYDEAVAIAKTQVDVSKLTMTTQVGCSYPQ